MFKSHNLSNCITFELKGIQASHQVFDILKSEFFINKNLEELYQKFDSESYDNEIRDPRNRMLVNHDAAMKFIEFLSKEEVEITDGEEIIEEIAIVNIGGIYYIMFKKEIENA